MRFRSCWLAVSVVLALGCSDEHPAQVVPPPSAVLVFQVASAPRLESHVAEGGSFLTYVVDLHRVGGTATAGPTCGRRIVLAFPPFDSHNEQVRSEVAVLEQALGAGSPLTVTVAASSYSAEGCYYLLGMPVSR